MEKVLGENGFQSTSDIGILKLSLRNAEVFMPSGRNSNVVKPRGEGMPSASEGNMKFFVVRSGKEWSENHQEAGFQAVEECSEGRS